MKKIFAMILVVIVLLSLLTGCVKETVKVTEKESAFWLTTAIIGGSVFCVPHHGWDYKGVNSDYEEISWRSVESYEIGDEVVVIH